VTRSETAMGAAMRRDVAAAARCAAAWLAAWAIVAPARAADPVATADAAFTTAAGDLTRRATAAGAEELAALIRGWQVPAVGDRQQALAVPDRLEIPAAIDTPAAAAIWDDFVAARRNRAAALFASARAGSTGPRAAGVDDLAARDSCATIALLYHVLRDDPDHDAARKAGGWVRRGDLWVSPQAARRIDKGEEYDAAFGWLPRGRLGRYRAGQRHDRGRWMSKEEDAARVLPIDRGRRFETDDWEILSTAPLEDTAGLAARLEETRQVWQQVFGGFGVDPRELAARIQGRGHVGLHEPFAAVFCRDRAQYVAELLKLEPTIGRTNGVYWTPTATAWFYNEPAGAADPGVDATDASGGIEAFTVHHEATHQLFAETRPEFRRTGRSAGERCGFWAIEAAACYMETIRPAPWGWTVGGRDAGRVPAARERLVEDGFYVPLAELTAMGRADFQADGRLRGMYSQLGGLADFFMNAGQGRYREAFVEYLGRLYAGSADADTLARLCRRTYAELDDEYRRHLSQ
jgi:hypothetical protein